MKKFELDIGLKADNDQKLYFILHNLLKEANLLQQSISSGFCFTSNISDIQFEFKTKVELEEAITNIKKVCDENNITIEYMEWGNR